MREITLPSGAVLKITLAPFADARDLYQAILRDLKEIKFTTKEEVTTMITQSLCIGFSSKEIEALIWKCLQRCVINNLKITEDTFEPAEARQDYIKVLAQVVFENVEPFMKSLFAEFRKAVAMTERTPA